MRSAAGGWIAVAGAVLLLAGCASERTPPAATVAVVEDEAARTAARRAGRAVWGVVPTAPERKQELTPRLIAGSAIAVEPGRLIAACAVIDDRDRVGLVRHNKYRIGRVAAVSDDGAVCTLVIDDTPLTLATGRRSGDDLRVGEPVYVLVNRTSSDLALAVGQVMARPPGTGTIKTNVVLERAADSAVVLDTRGNLVGLATGPSPDGNGTLAAIVPPGSAQLLAVNDLGPIDRLTDLLRGSQDATGQRGFSLLPLAADDGAP